jgi:hypothetical protein
MSMMIVAQLDCQKLRTTSCMFNCLRAVKDYTTLDPPAS